MKAEAEAEGRKKVEEEAVRLKAEAEAEARKKVEEEAARLRRKPKPSERRPRKRRRTHPPWVLHTAWRPSQKSAMKSAAAAVAHPVCRKRRSTKLWAMFTVFLYAVSLLLLTVPVAVPPWASRSRTLWASTTNGYTCSGSACCWPGNSSCSCCPSIFRNAVCPWRRPLKVPIIVTAFFLANLCFAGLVSLLCASFNKDAGCALCVILFFSWGQELPLPWTFGPPIVTATIFWVVWAAIFRYYAKADDEAAFLRRATRWLLAGACWNSLLPYPATSSCAAAKTAVRPRHILGIATGISVMLLCFGPGVYFLFVKRMNQLKRRPARESGEEEGAQLKAEAKAKAAGAVSIPLDKPRNVGGVDDSQAVEIVGPPGRPRLPAKAARHNLLRIFAALLIVSLLGLAAKMAWPPPSPPEPQAIEKPEEECASRVRGAEEGRRERGEVDARRDGCGALPMA